MKKVGVLYTGIFSSVFVLFALSFVPISLYSAKKPYNDAYSMEVQALKGPEMTDVYARFSTADEGAFPIPAQLKKMQVKIKDQDDEVVFILNKKSVDIVDGMATMAVGDPSPQRMLYVQSHIKTTTREVVLMGEAPVLFRPDLVVSNLSSPDTVKDNEFFDIEMIIQEVNHDVGATATVSLFDGNEQLVSMPDVYVPAGEQVTVVITSLGLVDIGTHSLTVVISDADPAEYDDTNNTYSFTVEVIEHIINQQSSFTLTYENYADYSYSYSYYNSCYYSTSNGKHGQWDLLELSADSDGEVPEGVIDEVWWQVETEAGIRHEKSTTAVAPVNISETLISYHIYDPGQNTIVDINAYPLDGLVQYTFRQQTGYYYSYSYYWGSWYYYTNPGDYVDAQDYVTLRLLIQDENLRIGGEATAQLSSTPVNEHSSSSGSSGSWWGRRCYWSRSETTTYTYIEGSATGTLSPAILAKSIRQAQASDAALPATISLDGTYPNPFNPETHIQFALPEGQRMSLVVYDVLGREVIRLVDGFMTAGYHNVLWRGQTQTGSPVPTGIYIARMTAEDYGHSIKLVLMK
ncbi:MAG: T9SS type A sorting domain-containing protein [Fidelibacterota bacterium]|nr:MAG: T9SS type A sorting domain-containing protein [Candidatus Neomarinimicrobiota bacterium]